MPAKYASQLEWMKHLSNASERLGDSLPLGPEHVSRFLNAAMPRLQQHDDEIAELQKQIDEKRHRARTLVAEANKMIASVFTEKAIDKALLTEAKAVAADLPFRHEVSYGVLIYRAGVEVQRRSRQYDEVMQRELRRPLNSPRRSLSKRRF